jgi:hypothetical protein
MGNESVTILRIFNGQFAFEKPSDWNGSGAMAEFLRAKTTDRWSESAADSYPGI